MAQDVGCRRGRIVRHDELTRDTHMTAPANLDLYLITPNKAQDDFVPTIELRNDDVREVCEGFDSTQGEI